MEDTSESKEEEIEPSSKKGRKPNKFHREIEIAQEKETRKQSSLDHVVKNYLAETKSREQVDGKKDRVVPQATKK